MSETTNAATVEQQQQQTDARTAGRGGVAVLGAKLFFLVVGFVQQPLMRFAVGLSDFGSLAQVLAVSNVVNNVVVQSGTQGVSRVVAGAKGHQQEALRAVLRVHLPLAVVVAALMCAATPVYAAFERAPDVVAPLLVLAGVAFLYGLYAPLIGFLNGTNRFGRQALLDVIFGTLRTIGLVGGGWLFVRHGLSGVLGITGGWVCAAVIIVPLALRSTKLGRRLPPGAARPAGIPTSGKYLVMLLPIAAAQLCTNILMQIDIGLLGRFLSEGAAATGLTGDARREAVKPLLAIYKECQTFAFLPYQLVFSITLILFPMLARAKAGGDAEAVRTYVARGARLAAIFGGLLVAVLLTIPQSMLAFAYPGADAARGAEVLRWMALAQAAFTMLGIATTVLTSIGRERMAAVLTLAAVIAVGAACWTFVPGTAFGHEQLVRSAQASGGALLVTLIVAGLLVKQQTGAFVPPATAVRVLAALGGCFALGFVAPRFGRLVTPVVAAIIGLAYVAFLVVTRELGKSDLALAKGVVRRGK